MQFAAKGNFWSQGARFDGITDLETTVGYPCEGKRTVGEKYINTSRQMTEKRKAVIPERLDQTADEGCRDEVFRLFDWEPSKQELIQEGIPPGDPSRKRKHLAGELQGCRTKANARLCQQPGY